MSLGFYFDQTLCVGCRACQVACKDRYNLIVAGPRPRRVESYESGEYPNAQMFHTSVGCNHCETPACVANCPTGAMYKDEDGLVMHDDDTCIQCQTCVQSCPYEAPVYIEEENLILKCDSCKALRDADIPAVCVQTCPYRALEFGDMDELRAAHPGELVSDLGCLPDSSQTGPNLLIKAFSQAVEDADPHRVRL